MIAGNKVGKTYTACMLTAAMVTGRYWPGYNGRKFNRAVQCWVLGPTYDNIRDTTQEMLLGPDLDEPGGGCIPKDCIVRVRKSRGVENSWTCRVKHSSGGISRITFKPYSKGAAHCRGQVSTLPISMKPEGADAAGIYSEILTRTVGNRLHILHFHAVAGPFHNRQQVSERAVRGTRLRFDVD